MLDIGSGVDATALAIDLFAPGLDVSVAAVEPSAEMRAAANFIRVSARNVRVVRVATNLGSLEKNQASLSGGPFDAVLLSASLPYGYGVTNVSEVRAFVSTLRKLISSSGQILVIEPGRRRNELDSLANALTLVGSSVTRADAARIQPPGVTLERRLDRTTQLLLELPPRS